jgi:hypothetical protein
MTKSGFLRNAAANQAAQQTWLVLYNSDAPAKAGIPPYWRPKSGSHGRNGMNTQVRDPHPPQNADEVDDNLLTAVKNEVKHEVHNIQRNKEPVDPTQSDVLVQKHFSGLFIVLLSLVVFFLIAAIAGIWIFWHH